MFFPPSQAFLSICKYTEIYMLGGLGFQCCLLELGISTPGSFVFPVSWACRTKQQQELSVSLENFTSFLRCDGTSLCLLAIPTSFFFFFNKSNTFSELGLNAGIRFSINCMPRSLEQTVLRVKPDTLENLR